ncbi:plexin domain containing lethal (1) G0289 isoform X2 [Rhodnius prolixus]|uniref:plexin domain containing lethal (1) G0289 isoform X2 n=1 Tax=Rhodnius prolixus TaxID=13249 RepID=UPI003D18E1B4
MAAVRLKCSFLVYFTLFCELLVLAVASDDFVRYQVVDHHPSEIVKRSDIKLLQRERRYVETAIPRLADNYFRRESYPSKSVDKDDLDTFSRRRGRMEMVGNLAISAEQLASASADGGGEGKHEYPPEEKEAKQSIKKATSTPLKKNQDLYPGKTTSMAVIGDNDHGDIHRSDAEQKRVAPTTTSTPVPAVGNTTITKAPSSTNSTDSHQDSVEHHMDNHTTMHEDHQDGHNHLINVTGTTPEDASVLVQPTNASVPFGDDDFPKDITNSTLVKNNITEKQVDNHFYYNSTFIVDPGVAKHYWVDLDREKDVIINKMLSTSHRKAATVKLSFDFPFYGHIIQKVTIATGGFLYTGDYIHSWLAATQYIAPLMANFDTGLSEDSQVRYTDNGSAFTVEWDRVHLQDKRDAGQFTFQVTLCKNGDIAFVYKDVPILVDSIEDCLHPVKVGISDAYIMDKNVFFVRKKTIYEYHRVSFKREDIKNWTVIYMSALPTCMSYNDCATCAGADRQLDCKWCAAINRCSSGYDRHRQDWLVHSCEHTAINVTSDCTAGNASVFNERQHQRGLHITEDKSASADSHVAVHSQAATDNSIANSGKTGHLGHSGLLGLLFFILTIAGLGSWLFYAYRNPHTTSGQVLIKYRPSQWSLRRGEARYTAATIHM